MKPGSAVRAGLWALAVALLGACSDSGTAQPTDPSLAPVTTPAPSAATTSTAAVPVTTPTAPTTTAAPDTTADTVAPTDPPATTDTVDVPVTTDTAPPTTAIPVTTTPGLTGPMFSDALGTKVDTAPGVNTPGDTRELMPGLWVHIAWLADPNDPSVFTVQPGDEEILEAYANARRVYYEAATTTVDVSSPEWAEYYTDAGEQYERLFSDRKSTLQVRDMADGVVLRPYVLGDNRDESSAVVFDCVLEGTVWRFPDGSISPTSEPGIGPTGILATMTHTNGQWQVDVIVDEDTACV